MGAEKGCHVKVHYTGTLEDGTVFDSSRDRDPLEFTLGAGQMIPGFDKGIEGMEIGEKRELHLSPEEAYGPRDKGKMFYVPKDNFPEETALQVGDMFHITTEEGFPMRATIAEIEEEKILFDGNHRLAGKDLFFAVELMEVSND